MKKVLLLLFIASVAFATAILVNRDDKYTTGNQIDRHFKSKKNLSDLDILKDKKTAILGHPSQFARLHSEIRNKPDSKYPPGYRIKALEKAKSDQKRYRKQQQLLDWKERGPGNVGGRTRGLLILPQDPTESTWLAGSVGGGIWKTIDRGQTWENKTNDFPSLSTTTLALSESNPEIIYAGTGESFVSINGVAGSGMYKSFDAGETWNQLPSTLTEDFNAINRIIVSPDDPDLVLVATERTKPFLNFDATSFIFRSEDGGETWTEMLNLTSAIEQIVADPTDFNIQYAAVNNEGVYKSTDAGLTWNNSSEGLLAGGRVEISVSPVDPDVIWASSQGGSPFGDGFPGLFVTLDGAENWTFIANSEDGVIEILPDGTEVVNFDFLLQPSYDNTVLAHPFDVNSVYVGGVDIFKFTLSDDSEIIEDSFLGLENNTDFVGLVNFGAQTSQGVLFNESLADSLKVSVEIRFGTGISQKAHRFTVGGEGAGVADDDYVYEDYVDVPFQVWDISSDPPRQLMASFRDQQEDGVFNLIEQNTSGDGSTHSREYLFVNVVDYDSTAPDPDIAINGGHTFNQNIFVWPFLNPGQQWNPEDLPESSLITTVGDFLALFRNTEVVADGRARFTSFTGEQQLNGNDVVHVDHHNLQAFDISQDEATFRIISANDGGVYYSGKNTDPGLSPGDWTDADNTYNTSQFYGADRNPNSPQFIGGMQDNDSRISEDGEEATATTEYTVFRGGDGFEAFWHSTDEDKLIGGSQFNGLVRRINGQFQLAVNGLPGFDGSSPTRQELYPFVTRIGASKSRPDVLFCLSVNGVFRSEDFAGRWELSTMDDNWAMSGTIGEVEVSRANPDIVWAGSFLDESATFQVSVDNGRNFTNVNPYTMNMGLSSGMDTHPIDDSTAYILFSFSGEPKILRTTDLGQSWEDISGFENTESSDRGFPDVAVYDLFVFPNNTDRIWACTDIGLVESLDNGNSWSLADNGLPNVAVWEIKQVGKELVLATHGRGIWSVNLDELSEQLIAPVVNTTGISPTGDLLIKADFGNAFDSTNIIVDGQFFGQLGSTPSGELVITLSQPNLDGTAALEIQSFKDGRSIITSEIDIEPFIPNGITDTFESDLETNGAANFSGTDFTVFLEDGLTSVAVHSEHPYSDQKDHIYTLKTPIVIDQDNPILSYQDIALVEPGEPGTVFGDFEFWDYVIVEGTIDGLTWQPILDGYDARADDNWLFFYNNPRDVVEDLFVSHRIDLTETFNDGDTVLFRFRLFADQATNGYGWVIKDINIQSTNVVTSVDDPLKAGQLSIFPNPVENRSINGSITTSENESTVFKLFDASGRLYQTYQRDFKSGINLFRLDLSEDLKPGFYLLSVKSDSMHESKRLIIE